MVKITSTGSGSTRSIPNTPPEREEGLGSGRGGYPPPPDPRELEADRVLDRVVVVATEGQTAMSSPLQQPKQSVVREVTRVVGRARSHASLWSGIDPDSDPRAFQAVTGPGRSCARTNHGPVDE